MSHIARVECLIRNLDGLEQAAAKKDAVLVRGQQTHKAYTPGRCDHAIKLNGEPDAYEVGVVARPDGDGYDLAFDDYSTSGRKLVDRFGHGLTGLRNEYLAVVAEQQLRKQGYRVTRTEQAQQVRLVAVR